MAISQIKELYLHELQEMYTGCNKSYEVTGKLMEQASDNALKSVLKMALEGEKRSLSAFEDLIKAHGQTPKGGVCKGLNAIVEEANEQAIKADYENKTARDLAIIWQYQFIVSYAISGFRTFLAHAAMLDFTEDVQRLSVQLAGSEANDRILSGIAAKLNAEALA
jgi:ferritin-like metal-binding protein YciE